MKKILIFVVLIVGLISVSFAFDVPAKSDRLVNDYIGLMTADQVQALETKLLDFEKKTSIQLSIVVLDDLDGKTSEDAAYQIFHAWGIGQKGLDNGILFLIVKYNQNAIEKLLSPKYGDWRIMPGYGMESYLTDAELRSIGESEFIPFAKEDRYYEGVDATVSRIISKLGEVGWQQREEFEAKRKAEAAEELRKFGNGILNFLMYVVLAGLLFWLIRISVKAAQKAQELKKKWATLKSDFAKEKRDYDELMTQIPPLGDYPDWAEINHRNHLSAVENLKELVPALLQTWDETVDNDLEGASRAVTSLSKHVAELRNLVERLTAIPAEIQKYKDEYPLKVSLVKDTYAEFVKAFDAYEKAGYSLPSFKASVNGFKLFLEAIDTHMLSEQDLSRDIYDESVSLHKKITEEAARMELFIQAKGECEDFLSTVTSKLAVFEKEKPAALLVLQSLKQHYPNSVWGDLDIRYSSLSALIREVQENKSQAEKNNSMDVQKFDEAKTLADKAQKTIGTALQYLQDIHDQKKEIEDAKASYSVLLATVEKSVNSARSKCSDSDVEHSAKQYLSNAISNLDKAKQLSSVSLVDWLAVVNFLTTSQQLAKKAYSQAESDIEEAKESRRKAAVAAAALVAAETSRRDSYDDDSSRGGGGFGGFGGGDTGGGGAGGSW